MSMKKKFLALALASMVAMPVVANASSKTQMVDGLATQPQNADVKITGTVNNNQGQAPAGKISVELPTAMSFTVDEASNVSVAGNFTVANRGVEAVDVFVTQFSETKPGYGITMKKREDLTREVSTLDRSNVSLLLINGQNRVDLADDTEFSVSNPYKLIDNLEGNQTVNVTIDGEAGEGTGKASAVDPTTTASVDDIGTSEEFVVTFKISKHSI